MHAFLWGIEVTSALPSPSRKVGHDLSLPACPSVALLPLAAGALLCCFVCTGDEGLGGVPLELISSPLDSSEDFLSPLFRSSCIEPPQHLSVQAAAPL